MDGARAMSGQSGATDDDYVVLRLWGAYMGSGATYVRDQLAQARAEGAPWNATYRRDDGWHTSDEITNLSALAAMGFYKRDITRNTVMARANIVGSLRDQLQRLADELRLMSGLQGIPEIPRWADLLDKASDDCNVVARRLAGLGDLLPRQRREDVEAALRPRLADMVTP